MKKVELLAPAGDLERLKVTLLYGADAVYLGGPRLGLRANATNFTMEELKEGCLFAHQLGKRVFLTANIVFHEEDRNEVESYLEEVVSCGIDAFIVSDVYLMTYIKEHYPEVEVHVSTQNSTTNSLAVKFYEELGATRVVLARELSKEEIGTIIKKTGMEIEVFIHGAMCTCYSGRCALSNYITNRDANRGGCAQVCRFTFASSDKTFTMASKDLNMASYIKDLIELGVSSLKVEGRMRSLYYLATVIGSYRALIDAVYHQTLTEDVIAKYESILSRVANREVTSQYFLKEANETDQYYTGRQELSNQDYLGLIVGYDETRRCLIMKERNYFKVGDEVEVFTPSGEFYAFIVEEIFDEDGNFLSVARHPDQVLYLPFPKKIIPYSMVRLKQKGKMMEEV